MTILTISFSKVFANSKERVTSKHQ
jgi:hypothetical protein